MCVLAIIKIRKLNKEQKLTKQKYYILKIILITIMCELTIFNINSYRIDFSKYEKKDISISECKTKNLLYNNENGLYVMEEDYAYITANNLNCEIGTVYFNAIIPDKERKENVKNTENALKYSIMYTDITSQNYRELPSKYLVNSIEKSKYTTCFLSGKSKNIGIKIYAPKGTNIKINSIKVNSKVPFEFNIFRVTIIIASFLLLYSLKYANFFNSSFEENKLIAIKIMIATMIFFVILNIFIAKNTISGEDDIYSKEYAEAIINGKFYLEKKPNEELLKLKNPYDSTTRVRNRDGWDIALFDGKFYVYFGILPEIILFVPYMIVFHKFLASGIGVVIFSVIAIMGLGILLLEILEKWFNKIPLKLWFYSEVILLSGALIFNLIGRPEFYEIAVASALCFSVFRNTICILFFYKRKSKI